MNLYPWKMMSTILLFLLFSLGLSSAALYADIYMYVDENGVRHFSNVPTSGQFEVFLRDRKARKGIGRSSTRFDPLITSASKKHRVAFPLVKAVIKAESDFNPKAVSRKGAKGLMQIMPQNYRHLNITNPFNPRENIMGGTRYLRYLLDRFDGKISLSLAAYNAGPEAVERYQGIPPYKETRNYVKKVLRYYRHFKNKG